MILTEKMYVGRRYFFSPYNPYKAQFNYIGNKYDLDFKSDGAGTVIATFESSLVRSSDYGLTWSYEKKPEYQKTLTDSRFPSEVDLESRLAYCGNGQWVHAFARLAPNVSVRSTDLYISRSTDNGDSWTSPTRLAGIYEQGGYTNNLRFLGDLAAEGSNVIIVYKDSFDAPYPLAVQTSGDAGATWSRRTDISSVLDYDAVLSLDFRDGKSVLLTDRGGDILAARSLDSGATWDGLSDVAHNLNATELIPDVVAGPDGSHLAVFEVNGTEGTSNAGRHIQTARSTDNGATWQLSSYIDMRVNAAQDWQLFE